MSETPSTPRLPTRTSPDAAATSSGETVEVRHGMFGADGTGDTSGYGGLVRPVPAARRHARGPTAAGSTRSADAPGAALRRRLATTTPSSRSSSTAASSPSTSRREHLRRRRAGAARRPGPAVRDVHGRLRRALPARDRPRAARRLPPAVDHPQPPGPRSRSPAPTPTRTSRRSSSVYPRQRLARARDLRLLRHRLRRPPRPDPDRDARRLARPPAAQGLPAGRHPGRVQGRRRSRRRTSGGRYS